MARGSVRNGLCPLLLSYAQSPILMNRAPALQRADALIRLGRIDFAIAEYQSALDADPEDEEIADRLAAAYARQGGTKLAASYFTGLAERLLQQTRLPAARA